MSKMRKFNNVVNTMRKNNIKYPFNYLKKQD